MAPFKRTVPTDERRVARLPISGVQATLQSPGDVRILDVGVYGLAIETAIPLEVGQRHFLELRQGRYTANVEVTVRWAGRVPADDPRAPMHAGVQFTEIFRDESGGIWDWLMVPGESPAEPTGS